MKVQVFRAHSQQPKPDPLDSIHVRVGANGEIPGCQCPRCRTSRGLTAAPRRKRPTFERPVEAFLADRRVRL